MDSTKALLMAIWLGGIAAWVACLLLIAGCVSVTLTQNGDGDVSTVTVTSMPMGTATIPVQVGPGSIPGL